MNAKRQFSLALIAAIMLSLFAATQWVFAQSETDTRVKIVGRVEAVTEGSLLVNGRAISTANASVDTEIAVGANVMIDGYLNADNQIEATTVTNTDANILLPDELRITGVLKSSSASSFNLGGSLVNSEDTDLNATLNAGAVVRVFADANGADWTARRVQVLNRSSIDLSADANLSADLDLLSQGSYQIVGTLDSMDDSHIVISGVSIDTANADIKSKLVTGALVDVWIRNTYAGFSASQVSNATLDADLNTDADTDVFVDVNASTDVKTDTSVDAANSDSNTDANVDANADVNAGVDLSGSTDSSGDNTDANANANVEVNANDNGADANANVGVNIDLGGGIGINLGSN